MVELSRGQKKRPHDVAYYKRYIKYTRLCGKSQASAEVKARVQLMRDLGAAATPFNSWLFLQGLETLALHMERHSQNAQRIAEFLEGHPAVGWVSYPGLSSYPRHDLAK